MFVGETGFEPATPWSQTRCATGLRYSPKPYRLSERAANVKEIVLIIKK